MNRTAASLPAGFNRHSRHDARALGDIYRAQGDAAPTREQAARWAGCAGPKSEYQDAIVAAFFMAFNEGLAAA